MEYDITTRFRYKDTLSREEGTQIKASQSYAAYLFASHPGGSYAGTGTSTKGGGGGGNSRTLSGAVAETSGRFRANNARVSGAFRSTSDGVSRAFRSNMDAASAARQRGTNQVLTQFAANGRSDAFAGTRSYRGYRTTPTLKQNNDRVIKAFRDNGARVSRAFRNNMDAASAGRQRGTNQVLKQFAANGRSDAFAGTRSHRGYRTTPTLKQNNDRVIKAFRDNNAGVSAAFRKTSDAASAGFRRASDAASAGFRRAMDSASAGRQAGTNQVLQQRRDGGRSDAFTGTENYRSYRKPNGDEVAVPAVVVTSLARMKAAAMQVSFSCFTMGRLAA